MQCGPELNPIRRAGRRLIYKGVCFWRAEVDGKTVQTTMVGSRIYYSYIVCQIEDRKVYMYSSLVSICFLSLSHSFSQSTLC
jgi:hypothetical protein